MESSIFRGGNMNQRFGAQGGGGFRRGTNDIEGFMEGR
jgi:hypothetical protein